MFLGHYAVALGAKRFAPRTSLGTLVFAAQFLDLVWPILVLLGVERVRVVPESGNPFTRLAFERYPISHSAALVLVWAAIVAGIYWGLTHYRAGTIALAVGVASHWVLDLIVHLPDLPVYPGGPEVGLGLWRSVPATVGLELGLLVLGLGLYLSATRPKDRVGSIGLAALVAFLLAVYAASALGPPPPSARAVGASGLLLWLLVPWAAWADRHRERVPRAAAAVGV